LLLCHFHNKYISMIVHGLSARARRICKPYITTKTPKDWSFEPQKRRRIGGVLDRSAATCPVGVSERVGERIKTTRNKQKYNHQLTLIDTNYWQAIGTIRISVNSWLKKHLPPHKTQKRNLRVLCALCVRSNKTPPQILGSVFIGVYSCKFVVKPPRSPRPLCEVVFILLPRRIQVGMRTSGTLMLHWCQARKNPSAVKLKG